MFLHGVTESQLNAVSLVCGSGRMPVCRTVALSQRAALMLKTTYAGPTEMSDAKVKRTCRALNQACSLHEDVRLGPRRKFQLVTTSIIMP